MITRRRLLATGTASVATATTAWPWREALAGNDHWIDLTAAPDKAPLLEDGGETSVWAYNGKTPGPTLRVRRGETIRVRLHNGLEQPTSIHWHGIRIDNAMDGVSGLTQDPAPPGGTFDYVFSAPDSGSFWYHPHHRSWEQMARGLYGLLIVEEDAPVMVEREIEFVADDWRLNDQGQIDEASFGSMMDWSHQGRLGNWLTVNGLTEPAIPVRSGERLRLRCVNVANARTLAFDFDRDQLSAWVVALDGQPIVPTELASDGLRLAPAQRADLIVDVLEPPGGSIPIYEVSTRERIQAAILMVSATAPLRQVPPPAPDPLPANPLPQKLSLHDAQVIPLLMEGGAMGGMREARYQGAMLDIGDLVATGKVWAFNGIVGRTADPLARIPLGRTVVIDMINDTAWPHAMHLHGHHFRVVERGGKTVTGTPWRDTELVERGKRVSIAFVADNPGKWLFHCHMLEHQAAGMIAWIEVA
ncbi:MAG: multicopper oxidase family protein [Alphaproteobacteria bacterium]|jgi:FtsP/CotA-like multicopper oxidase with cupredoxin domain